MKSVNPAYITYFIDYQALIELIEGNYVFLVLIEKFE